MRRVENGVAKNLVWQRCTAPPPPVHATVNVPLVTFRPDLPGGSVGGHPCLAGALVAPVLQTDYTLTGLIIDR